MIVKIIKNFLIVFGFFIFSCTGLFAQKLQTKVIKFESPIYPPAARAVRAKGDVVVTVAIDNDGKVISANSESGHPLLRAAAQNAAKQWIFSPLKEKTERKVEIKFIYIIKTNDNINNNYKKTAYKTKFKKPFTLEITATIYPTIDY